jgi:hypothetical protein
VELEPPETREEIIGGRAIKEAGSDGSPVDFRCLLQQSYDSTRDLLNILHSLADKGAKFKSLLDPWCDTSTPQGELMVTILAGAVAPDRHGDLMGDGVNVAARLAALTTSKHALAAPSVVPELRSSVDNPWGRVAGLREGCLLIWHQCVCRAPTRTGIDHG